MHVRSESPARTQELAAELAARVISREPSSTAQIITLEGELGAGKTTFVQGFARALGVIEFVRSPTFLLMKSYSLNNGRTLFHIDCYRVRDSQDLVHLEIKDIFNDPKNIVLIEWPERISDIIPPGHLLVHLDHVDEQVRQITITP